MHNNVGLYINLKFNVLKNTSLNNFEPVIAPFYRYSELCFLYYSFPSVQLISLFSSFGRYDLKFTQHDHSLINA